MAGDVLLDGNRVPEKIMADILKSAVQRRISGEAPVLNPPYLDFARDYGFRIVDRDRGDENGRVEPGVAYVKKNCLSGLDNFASNTLDSAARVRMVTIASLCVHGETHARPVDRFAKEHHDNTEH